MRRDEAHRRGNVRAQERRERRRRRVAGETPREERPRKTRRAVAEVRDPRDGALNARESGVTTVSRKREPPSAREERARFERKRRVYVSARGDGSRAFEGRRRDRTSAIRASVAATRRAREKGKRVSGLRETRGRGTCARETHREDPKHVRGYEKGECRSHRIVCASRDGTRGACAGGHARTLARACTAEPFSVASQKRRFAADKHRTARRATAVWTDACRAPRTSLDPPDRRSIEATGRHSEWRAPPDGSAVHETRPDRLTVAVA